MSALNPKISRTAKLFLAGSQHSLAVENLPRIINCLNMLPEKEIWWRPNSASNSVGNLVLHLSGNITQWIISGLGGAPDTRERDLEFAECGPIPRTKLAARIRRAVREACIVLDNLSEESLSQNYNIQGFRVTGMYAVSHVSEHFAYHTGQIIFVTKLKRGKDLGFTHLPAIRPNKSVTK